MIAHVIIDSDNGPYRQRTLPRGAGGRPKVSRGPTLGTLGGSTANHKTNLRLHLLLLLGSCNLDLEVGQAGRPTMPASPCLACRGRA